MSQSTKSMLTMMNPNIKPAQTAQRQSTKKPVEQKASTRPSARVSAQKQMVDAQNIDEPVNEMKNILDMCISSQNKNKPKLNQKN